MFIGATGKSAQIPLYVWLPDAMEGPDAGVGADPRRDHGHRRRLHDRPQRDAVRACADHADHRRNHRRRHRALAGTIGLVQNDIKRVLAYSTVSQLGYMFLAMGVGAYGAGIFHLYTHAFFKACLFLGSGAVIHALHGEQDIRNMGGLKKHIPITYWTFVIASVAIAGVPLLSGFFSKDEILFETFVEGHQLLWGMAS
jgi:NADH-quinone oxidoreductase subunit L